MFGKAKKQLRHQIDKDKLPIHVAIIMDGNGRWAKKRGLPRTAGHTMGAKNLENIVEYAGNIGIKYLTVYAFSTENWLRPPDEVESLMNLMIRYMKDYENLLGAKDARVRFLGAREKFSSETKELMEYIEKRSEHKKGINFNIALNYGGREEIVNAFKIIAHDVKNQKLNPSDITEDIISQNLYTKDIPDPDLIIRPSGELRLSNFLLWQCAYSELWFSNYLWPDFTPKRFETALLDYQKRERRFGGV